MRCARSKGAYALVGITNKKVVGARDPLGISPLVIGELGGRYILASETCALDIIGARHRARREERRGRGDHGGGDRIAFPLPAATDASLHLRIHLFLAAGFDRERAPDLHAAQGDGHGARARNANAAPMWWCPSPIRAFRPHLGFAQESGIPYELGIIRNHYVGRTFIEPTQSIRALGVRMKHSANRAVVEGKRIVLDRQFDRARHDIGEDRAHDAGSRRE